MAVALDEVWGRVKNVCKQNGLLILSVLAVVIGCLLGFFLRGKQLSEQVSCLTCLVVIELPGPPSHSPPAYLPYLNLSSVRVWSPVSSLMPRWIQLLLEEIAPNCTNMYCCLSEGSVLTPNQSVEA